MHPALDEDEAELGVHVRPVPVQVLPDRDGLLDEEVEVLGHLWCEAAGPEHAQDLDIDTKNETQEDDED